jgi:hypothetical protein
VSEPAKVPLIDFAQRQPINAEAFVARAISDCDSDEAAAVSSGQFAHAAPKIELVPPVPRPPPTGDITIPRALLDALIAQVDALKAQFVTLRDGGAKS